MHATTTLLAAALTLPAQTFEIASVKPGAPNARGGGIDVTPGGRFTAVNVSLRALLRRAYAIRDFQIANPPAWFDSQRYDVEAKPPAGENATDDRMRAMLQSLLADRFKLAVHRETKEVHVYALTVSKHGAKLQPASSGDTPGRVSRKGAGLIAGVKASPAQLAEALSDVALNGRYILDRPVLDRTQLNGVYDFMLEWTPEPGQFGDGARDPSVGSQAGPSLFTAIEQQLGLKLELQKAAVEICVIDHVEKASEN